ncbi:MAG: adenosylcobinamide-GDP ribazoletransferase [Gammaproteobacteria bacterium]|nr:adenosylcobinamide-GDP ribazoletransferase [Gammaproteobacteria bacterium]MBU0848392.1 adenosylcobinamide-GDP ribazoletransferase [Gammaproteobacteria bacterium]MBU1268205.1 adenosylcobinamide-GDP ribazoletransferase [Gammaproteobacteria bacterium]MBU1529237.1 adenosylcobinamide-GDP ribazoletransferase [Gammaproteobacteria bacterium]MBU1780399.1 adenosylcobinamide-GDP ribazoletransferase [Gammaproteobacteria bacterium]
MLELLTQFIRHYLLAVQFFTRIPVTGKLAEWVGFSPAMLRASAAHFPGVGWLVGASSAAVLWGLARALPEVPASSWVASVLCTVFSVLLTGAFHEDGLADTVDGLGGSSNRERALDIMKDSRVGTYGALALVLIVLLKVGLLAMLLQLATLPAAAATVFGAHVVSRLMPLFIIRGLPHVGDTQQSKSKPLADQIGNGSLLAATVWTGLALGLLYRLAPDMPWWAAVLGSALALAWMWRLLQRRLGGFTGDGLGATQQLCEVAFYLGLLLAWPLRAV